MKTLHITPSDSACGSLREALRLAGRDEEVLPFRDDLSCGPIGTGDPTTRGQWWEQFRFYDASEVDEWLLAFWRRVVSADDHLVVWFGRHSAMELSFLLSWVDRLGDRSYKVVDVTGLRLPFTKRDGSSAVTQPAQDVSSLPTEGLKSLFGTDQQFAAQDREEASRVWQRLKAENASFRVITPTGLASAPLDHFDALLLKQATTDWVRANRIIGNTMGYNLEPYRQVGDVMLRMRLVALVNEGKLLADADPWEVHSCRVRLAAT